MGSKWDEVEPKLAKWGEKLADKGEDAGMKMSKQAREKWSEFKPKAKASLDKGVEKSREKIEEWGKKSQQSMDQMGDRVGNFIKEKSPELKAKAKSAAEKAKSIGKGKSDK